MTASRALLRERYELLAEVGRGGMGRVWRARDTELNRTVAIKEILLGPGLDEADRARTAARARREAQAIAMGQHPNIVTVHDILEEDGRPWIVMEFLTGESLHRLVGREGPAPARRVAAWGLDLLDALGAAHAQGITHRDVKPENVMVTGTGRVVLTDFGIAAISDTAVVTQTAGVMGSPAYLAPERLASAPASPASDLWSLGATLYQAATGVSPFRRDGIPATLHAVSTAEPPRVLPGSLGAAVQGLLVKDPARRMDAAACRRLLEAAAGEDTTVAATAPAPVPGAFPAGTVPVPAGDTLPRSAAPPARERRLSWPVVVLTLGLAALVVVAAAVVFVPQGDDGAGIVQAGQADQASSSAEGTSTAAEETSGAGSPEEVDGTADEAAADDPAAPGMTWTRDPEGFAVLVPDGWIRRTDGASVFYDSPANDAYLQIDQTPHPTDDEYAHVLEQERASAEGNRLTGYERIRVADVTSRTSFHSAAEWEFTWNDAGTARHILTRNIAAAPGEHYTVAWASNEGVWAQDAEWRAQAFDSFQPI
ncbi:serine/threonine-protein kinase [Nocardiopsis lucentensis]|uniref:serine/threonine-protein kinase n=1 Tax=Nocardiopsis lucentensis TaxID=53441 RepID=UPI00034C0F2E|nr:serine/threonine-protein kinase [Nocardiopsis lucentensis]